ncbi:MAG: ArsB/NhaD family transporter [Thermotogae bacterium]|nr:ArsB/NhaD family transporter [Thermotogota bacterium]
MLLLFKIVVLVLFATVYYCLITGKFDKAAIAFIAGALAIFMNSILKIIPDLSVERLSDFVDFDTIGLLIGMMIILPFIKKSGFFEYMAVQTLRLSKGNLKVLFIMINVTTAISSAFLNNVSTVMVFIPIILAITDSINKNPFPFLMSLVFSANIGGTATLIGDPPNMLVGFAAHKSFMDFIYNVSPGVLLTFLAIIIYLMVKEKKYFVLSEEERQLLRGFMEKDPKEMIRDRKLLLKSLGAFAGAIAGFTVPPTIVKPSVVALTAAAIFLLMIKADAKVMEEVYKEIEWSTIFFFLGMFTLIFALEKLGFIDIMSSVFIKASVYPFLLIFMVLWIPLLAASILSAVPMVMVMIPIVQRVIGVVQLNSHVSSNIWWALVLGACFGGNMTMIGAAANIVVSGLTSNLERGRITFSNFFKYAFPVVMISGVIATFYITIKTFL